MSRIARHGKITAQPGKAEELAERLLAAAAELEGDPGCLVYLINRQADDPDTVWVTELWRSEDDLDAAADKVRGSENAIAVMALAESFEMVELDLLGGKGPA